MMRQCLSCGIVFHGKPKSKFCSMTCYGKSKIGKDTCNKGKKTGFSYWTGKKRDIDTIKKIRLTKSLNKYSHSEEVRYRISRKLIGVSKGGVSKLSSLVRGTSPYKQWRKSVFDRDEYTCQECGMSGVYINADHIIPFSILMRKNKISSISQAEQCADLWDIGNGRTLCLDCHKKTITFGNRKHIKEIESRINYG